MREYYIRREGDEDASGPYDIDQISSLIEAEKLDASAFYYDIETESWLTLSSNEELMATLFPKKRKLTLRTEESEAEKERLAAEAAAAEKAAEAERKAAAKAQRDAEIAAKREELAEDKEALAQFEAELAAEKEQETAAAQTEAEAEDAKKKKGEEPEPAREKLEVTRMLAVAEGRAHDSSGKTPQEKKAAVAFIGLRMLTVFFIVSAFVMGWIERDLVKSANVPNMMTNPYVIIGLVDAIIVVVLLLQVTLIYPLLRFRAAIGAGLLTLLFYASGDTLLLVSNLLLMVAIYFCSAIIRKNVLVFSGICGLLGSAGYVYALFFA